MLSPDALLPVSRLAQPLLAWYRKIHANRDMPWRKSRDPYAIWLSEIMLQQTQVETVKPYFLRFLERFPTIADLAAAPRQDVLALWAGLGYYRRAKHLHRAAQEVVAAYGGAIPADLAKLRALPGIGRYTAGAIASIAFNLPVPVVDGNVMRVLARLTGYDKDIAQAKNHDFFWQTALEIVQGAGDLSKNANYGDVNQALMELGATVCVPSPARPACQLCPVREFCRAFAEGRQMELPVKSRRPATPVVRGTALVLLRNRGSQALLVQRPHGSLWEGMWEFPVFPGRPGAKTSAAMAITWGVKSPLPCGKVKHQLTHRTMLYDVLTAHVISNKFPSPPPLCGDADQPYTAACWVSWPLARHGALPLAKVVYKIAELVVRAS